ncbi:hypothetical protein HUU42_05710 [bacterium]|nr:hypothetical protein [bacterium]
MEYGLPDFTAWVLSIAELLHPLSLDYLRSLTLARDFARMELTVEGPMAQNDQVRPQRKKQKPAERKAAAVNASPNSLLTNIGIVSGIFAILAAIVAIVNSCIDIDLKVSPTLTPPIITTVAPTATPTPTPLYTPGPLTFIERPEQINAGSDIRIIVQAWEGAACYLKYFTPDGNESKADGLGPASPDRLNRCTWVWMVNRNTHEGKGSIVVLVGEFEETHSLDILP